MKITRQLLSNNWYKFLTEISFPKQVTFEVANRPLAEKELKTALSILSADKNKKMLLLQSLNEDPSLPTTRSKYVNELTNIMNELNLPKDKNLPMLERDHFGKIVDGLTIITNNKFSDLASISLKDLLILIRNIGTEEELIDLFDTFYYTGKLTTKIAIEMLLSENLVHVEKLTNKILNSNKYIKWSKKDYNDFELSFLQKYYQCKNFDKIKELVEFYGQNEYWIQAIQNKQVSAFAERTLWKFCLMFASIDVNVNTLKRINNNCSNWLLLESFQFYCRSNSIDNDAKYRTFNNLLEFLKVESLTREQAILYEFLSNELVRSSIDEINSILKISLIAKVSSSTTSIPAGKTLIRELTRKIIQLQQRYEDYDLSLLNAKLNEFVKFEHELKSEEMDKNTRVMQLSKLFELQ